MPRDRRATSRPDGRDAEPVFVEDPASDSSADGGHGAATFAETLWNAVAASGLSLDRLYDRLAERGVHVSVATLSYWKSGRSTPGRRVSFETISHLEDVLDLTPGVLANLVPQRALGLRRVDVTRTFAESIGDGVEVPRSIAELDARLRRQMEMISEHAVVTIGADRDQQSRSTRRILRALSDGVDRILLADQVEDDSAPPPRIVPLVHCSLGRRHQLDASSFVITELLFDRQLVKGDAMMIEYRMDYGPPYPYDTFHEERKQMPLRDFVLEVCFHPAALPARCEWYESSALDPTGAERVTPVRLSTTNSVLVMRHDVQPSQFGLRWFWD